jgi:hypothetical protein
VNRAGSALLPPLHVAIDGDFRANPDLSPMSVFRGNSPARITRLWKILWILFGGKSRFFGDFHLPKSADFWFIL